MTERPTIAFLGTGLMGLPMAQNLLRADYPVRAYNRTAAKAAPLAKSGGLICATPAKAASGSQIVISMLTDGPTTAGVMLSEDMDPALREGQLWIDMCSAKPGEAQAQAAALEKLGIGHLDAPVSGGEKGAQDATLAIMAGGTAEAFERAMPVLQAMGRPVHVGPAGSGQLAKLANQAIVGCTIAAVAEAMLLLQKGGADPAAVRAALKGGFADSTILQMHGARMTTGNFQPGGASANQLKDLDNALAEAESLNLTLPATQSVRDRFVALCETLDGKDLDHSALYLELLDRQAQP